MALRRHPGTVLQRIRQSVCPPDGLQESIRSDRDTALVLWRMVRNPHDCRLSPGRCVRLVRPNILEGPHRRQCVGPDGGALRSALAAEKCEVVHPKPYQNEPFRNCWPPLRKLHHPQKLYHLMLSTILARAGSGRERAESAHHLA